MCQSETLSVNRIKINHENNNHLILERTDQAQWDISIVKEDHKTQTTKYLSNGYYRIIAESRLSHL